VYVELPQRVCTVRGPSGGPSGTDNQAGPPAAFPQGAAPRSRWSPSPLWIAETNNLSSSFNRRVKPSCRTDGGRARNPGRPTKRSVSGLPVVRDGPLAADHLRQRGRPQSLAALENASAPPYAQPVATYESKGMAARADRRLWARTSDDLVIAIGAPIAQFCSLGFSRMRQLTSSGGGGTSGWAAS
jgi:hypothetical protein